jgi:hypothetical protein
MNKTYNCKKTKTKMIPKQNLKLHLGAHDLGAGQADPVTEVVGQAQVDTHLAGINWKNKFEKKDFLNRFNDIQDNPSFKTFYTN